MEIGWVPDKFPLSDDEPAFEEYRQRWEGDVQALLGDIFEPFHDDEPLFPDLTREEGKERLKDLSPLWDSCLADVSIIDQIHSTDLIDLTDSELSADSDPFPMTPKAGKYSLSASPSSIKPLNATASSFVPSPAKFNPLRSPPSSSPSPSPSPPVLDIVNFPTLRQTILPQSRKDDLDGKSKWSSKRQNSVVPSFLTEKADSGSRRSKTRQMVDKMRSASDARKPDPDFILMVDDRPTTEPDYKPIAEEHLGSSKSKKRTRRGRESISTVSTDSASIRSSSAEGSGSNQHSFPSIVPSRPQGTRPPSKHSKRNSSSSVRPPLTIPTPPTPAFSSPAASVSSFGGPVAPGSFGLPFPPPPPPHHAFIHMGGRTPSYPPPFPYPYYSGMPGGGILPPTPFGNSYQTTYTPYNAYGKGVITGASGIRHASW
jgi:hypothetical protein